MRPAQPSLAGDAKHNSSRWWKVTVRGCESQRVFRLRGLSTAADTDPAGLFADTPVGSDSNGTGGLYFSESNVQRLEWLSMKDSLLNSSSLMANTCALVSTLTMICPATMRECALGWPSTMKSPFHAQ